MRPAAVAISISLVLSGIAVAAPVPQGLRGTVQDTATDGLFAVHDRGRGKELSGTVNLRRWDVSGHRSVSGSDGSPRSLWSDSPTAHGPAHEARAFVKAADAHASDQHQQQQPAPPSAPATGGTPPSADQHPATPSTPSGSGSASSSTGSPSPASTAANAADPDAQAKADSEVQKLNLKQAKLQEFKDQNQKKQAETKSNNSIKQAQAKQKNKNTLIAAGMLAGGVTIGAGVIPAVDDFVVQPNSENHESQPQDPPLVPQQYAT